MIDFLRALALLLVIEGIMPFLSPTKWRDALQILQKLEDKTLRIMGLTAMLVGVILLILIHRYID